MYLFTNTIDNGAKPNAHLNHAQKMLDTEHLHQQGKYLCKNLEGRGCFARDYFGTLAVCLDSADKEVPVDCVGTNIVIPLCISS